MNAMTARLCHGTVVVHKDLAVTCTNEFCRSDMPRATWLSIHRYVLRCVDATGDSRCQLCDFESQSRTATHGTVQI
jgi:hypothetical protein